MREVAWVIYDEVHYMRDKERGVVWEESIILLPHKVRFVFLSATIPNAPEFVGWITKLHHQPCHVVYTDYRPVPLRHFIFPAAAEGLFLVVDEKGKFREDNFQRAMSGLQGDNEETALTETKKSRKPQSKNLNSDLFKIVKLIMDRQLDPCIVFSFSKKDCETYALQMARMDFNNDEEKQLVEEVFVNAMEALSEDDKELPQVMTILPLLKRGVGIHHGGLLPILKEVIEILFQEGLIKCLFATETFSIGINMPAKTVVFTATRKYDGKDFRWITSGEYIQMSGRAGRRGKDDQGIVIQMIDEKMDPDVTKNMIYGASDPLYSSYHVSYNMVLNMLRVEDANPENLIRSSFFQFQQEQSAPELERQADELQREALTITVEKEELAAEYVSWKTLLDRTGEEINGIVTKSSNREPFLQAGRMLRVNYDGVEWGWGVAVVVRHSWPSRSGIAMNKVVGVNTGTLQAVEKLVNAADYIVDILLEVCKKEGKDSHLVIQPTSATTISKTGSKLELVHVTSNAIVGLGAIKMTLPADLVREPSRLSVLKGMREVVRRFEPQDKGGVPLLDPIKDMGIENESLPSLTERYADLQARVNSSPFNKLVNKDVLLDQYTTKLRLQEESKVIRLHARESQAVVMKNQLKQMKRVLKRFDYISADDVLCLKGKFSCELSTGDELVLTNMIFDGTFNDLSINQTVALLSCFVHKEAQKNGAAAVRNDMQASFRQLQTVARGVAGVLLEHQLITDEEEYVASFNPGLVDVSYAWCSGAKFIDVCKLTDIFEGSIIRALRRLEELLRQVAAASLAIGNSELMHMFEEGSKKIRRGVVFAASLYI